MGYSVEKVLLSALIYVGAFCALFIAIASWFTCGDSVRRHQIDVASVISKHPYLMLAVVATALGMLLALVVGTMPLPLTVSDLSRQYRTVRTLVPTWPAGGEFSVKPQPPAQTCKQAINSVKDFCSNVPKKAENAKEALTVVNDYFAEMKKYHKAHKREQAEP